jgi:hypothetical protein
MEDIDPFGEPIPVTSQRKSAEILEFGTGQRTMLTLYLSIRPCLG